MWERSVALGGVRRAQGWLAQGLLERGAVLVSSGPPQGAERGRTTRPRWPPCPRRPPSCSLPREGELLCETQHSAQLSPGVSPVGSGHFQMRKQRAYDFKKLKSFLLGQKTHDFVMTLNQVARLRSLMEGWNRTAQLRARVKLGAPPREEGPACPGRLGKHCSSLPFVREHTLSRIWGWGTQTHPAPQVKRECACSGPHT